MSTLDMALRQIGQDVSSSSAASLSTVNDFSCFLKGDAGLRIGDLGEDWTGLRGLRIDGDFIFVGLLILDLGDFGLLGDKGGGAGTALLPFNGISMDSLESTESIIVIVGVACEV